MNTKSAISTISYNTQLYFKQKLDELIDAEIIQFYAFIMHKPEDDEAGNKWHMHLYAEPASQLSTIKLGKEFIEFVPDNPKPLKCITWRKSKFQDWVLYGIHDADYLLSKNQTRRYHYDIDDVVTSDYDTLMYMFRSIDFLELSPYKAMRQAHIDGVSFMDFFRRGSIPITQIEHYMTAWDLMCKDDQTNRNGRKGHE